MADKFVVEFALKAEKYSKRSLIFTILALLPISLISIAFFISAWEDYGKAKKFPYNTQKGAKKLVIAKELLIIKSILYFLLILLIILLYKHL